MSAPSSRRKRKTRKKQSKRARKFRVVIDAQEIAVVYKPNWTPDTAHFEFRSPHRPPRRIPISETGYLSHFAEMAEVKSFASPQEYAREAALSLLRQRMKNPPDSRQLSLF